jgi:hypothetical protein
VTWTADAQGEFDVLMMRPAGGAGPSSQADVSRALQWTFPRARSVVVLRLYRSYRRFDGRFILLVDVNQERPGRHVVKLGQGKPAETIRQELHAYQQCWPKTVRHDPVLMPLVAGCNRQGWSSLIYGDAQQFIGRAGAVPLETAVLDCVLRGSPCVASLRQLLFQLYERLDWLLYRGAELDCSSQTRDGIHFRLPRVWGSLQLWNHHQGPERQSAERWRMVREVRHTADTSNEPSGRFLDPVDYLEYVKQFTTWQVPRREVTGQRSDTGVADLPAERPRTRPADDLIPSFWRGPSHGDLHGLNVLVGRIEDRALWPAVFDYEDMAWDNAIGWDFVKLETELKIRALKEIYPTVALDQFANRVQQFEEGLNRWTDYCQNHRTWPALDCLPLDQPPADRHPDSGTSLPAFTHETLSQGLGITAQQLCRLRAIVLESRHRAAQILGYGRGRSEPWLREHRFLLMCYGVSTVRFDNVDDFLLMAAFKSAGVAAAWLCG